MRLYWGIYFKVEDFGFEKTHPPAPSLLRKERGRRRENQLTGINV